jgi:hypothetical protein
MRTFFVGDCIGEKTGATLPEDTFRRRTQPDAPSDLCFRGSPAHRTNAQPAPGDMSFGRDLTDLSRRRGVGVALGLAGTSRPKLSIINSCILYEELMLSSFRMP